MIFRPKLALASFAGSKLSHGLNVQIRVVGALIVREAMSRYGHENLGFFWVMGEPLILTVGVMIMWSLTGQAHGTEVGVVPFALTGYSLLTLWRHIVFKSAHGMRHNASLAYHANVKFLDILLARALLETIGILAAFMIAYAPLYLLDYIWPIRDPLVLFGAWFITAWFCFAFGLIVAGLSELYESFERFLQPVMYLTLPVTGTFYMVDWLPLQARALVLLSPLVHANEMFRSGLFPADITTEWDVLYLVSWCLVMTAIGLPLCKYAQRHVQSL